MPTLLRQEATTVADTSDITISFWFRFPSGTLAGETSFFEFGDPSGEISWISASTNGSTVGSITAHFESPTYLPDFDSFKIADNIGATTFALGAWHHIIVATSFGWTSSVNAAGPWPLWIYVDGASRGQGGGSVTGVSSVGGPPPRAGTGILVQGTEIAIPHQLANTRGLNDTTFQMADFQAWFGTYINPSVAANFAKFVTISNGIGRPVNPAIARAAFGQQTFLFTGNKNQFSVNRGDGGAMTQSGALNNFTPIPGYV